jgi:hypothetical protein
MREAPLNHSLKQRGSSWGEGVVSQSQSDTPGVNFEQIILYGSEAPGRVSESNSGTCSECVRIEISIAERQNSHVMMLDGLFATDSIPYSRRDIYGQESDKCQIEFGLRGGRLQVKLTNAKAPIRGRYNPPMPETYQASSTFSAARTQSFGSKLSVKGFLPTFGFEGSDSETFSGEDGSEYARATMSASGPEDNPAWKFECGASTRHLSGRPPGRDPPLSQLQECKGTIGAFAVFWVRPSDLTVVGIHPENFSDPVVRKRLAIIAQALPTLLRRKSFSEANGQLALAFSSASFQTGRHDGAPGGLA